MNRVVNIDKLRCLIVGSLDMSVTKFCKEVKVNRTTIDRILHKRGNQDLRLLTLKKICDYFNKDFRDYLGE